MKRSNFLTFLVSTFICSITLILSYKFFTVKNPKQLVEYDEDALILAHENRYNLEEIREIRNSFKKSLVYTEVLHEESLTTGKYLNKLSNGSRKTYNNSSCKKAPREKIIWVLGGSTTYGYGVEDYQTIPSQLAKKLKLRGENWCVMNFGRGWYYSSQELLEYTRLISRTKKLPNHVIFIDGLNDFFHLFGSSFIPQGNGNINSVKFYNKIFHNRFTQRIFGNPIVSFKKNGQEIHQNPCEISDNSTVTKSCEKLIKKANDRMIKNWEVASKLSQSYNINFIPILQPVPLYQHYFTNPFSKGIYENHRFSGIGYSQMDAVNYESKEKMKSLKYIDASSIFKKPNQSCKMPYVDPVHYSGCGSKLIADLILKRIES